MDKHFTTIMRKGKEIDMFSEIEDLQDKYLSDLQASVDAFDTYDEVSAETFNDFNSLRRTLSIFNMLGYLLDEEYADMVSVADEQRNTVLGGLSRE